MPDWSSSFCTGMEKESPSAILYFDSWVTLQTCLLHAAINKPIFMLKEAQISSKRTQFTWTRKQQSSLGLSHPGEAHCGLTCMPFTEDYQALNWPRILNVDCWVFCSVVKAVLWMEKPLLQELHTETSCFYIRQDRDSQRAMLLLIFSWLLLVFDILPSSGTWKQTGHTAITLPFRI